MQHQAPDGEGPAQQARVAGADQPARKMEAQADAGGGGE